MFALKRDMLPKYLAIAFLTAMVGFTFLVADIELGYTQGADAFRGTITFTTLYFLVIAASLLKQTFTFWSTFGFALPFLLQMIILFVRHVPLRDAVSLGFVEAFALMVVFIGLVFHSSFDAKFSKKKRPVPRSISILVLILVLFGFVNMAVGYFGVLYPIYLSGMGSVFGGYIMFGLTLVAIIVSAIPLMRTYVIEEK